ncbi:hypothetical protein B0H17DRAFT_1126702 [Mycena rosella]|uniref:MYND-type domain-containing protein n=1 Tax=Mycena rosella TaxID=1033263 RepID=A0AAD7GSK7_MYCRO|nr:hypothetical protein B0H17DRAFT_1126702 [Mycena rosella]
MSSPVLHTFPSIDGEAVINLFVASLEDPRNPKHCPRCLSGCILAFFHNTLDPEYVHESICALRQNHHLFLDRCIIFLTLERSQDELAACAAWIGCDCDLSDNLIRKLHDLTLQGGVIEPSIDRFMGHIVAVVHGVLQPAKEKGGIHKVAHNAEKAAKQGKNVLWPTKPSDLLPFGPESSVRALDYWIGRLRTARSIGLVGSMFEICKRSMTPALVTSRNIALASLLSIGLSVKAYEMLDSLSPLLATPAMCLTNIMSCTVFFLQLHCFCDRHKLLKFFAEIEEFLFQTTKTVLELLPKMALDVKPYTSETDREVAYIERVLKSLAGAVHCYLELPFDSKTYHPGVLAYSRNLLLAERDPASMAYLALYQLACDERCCAPGCIATFASLGRKFSACGGCSRVPFCSKQCLARAWKHPRVAHKDVCKKIRALVLATGLATKPGAGDLQLFRDKCKAGMDEANVADVALHMQRLFKEMSSAFNEEEAGTHLPEEFEESFKSFEMLAIKDQ